MVGDTTVLESSSFSSRSWELLSSQVMLGRSLDPLIVAEHVSVKTTPAACLPVDDIDTVTVMNGVGLGIKPIQQIENTFVYYGMARYVHTAS